METAIQVVWWIGLIGALFATLAILKEVALILRTLRGIHRLAEITRAAARGVASNSAAASDLDRLEAPAQHLNDSARSVAAAIVLIETRLGALAGSHQSVEDGA